MRIGVVGSGGRAAACLEGFAAVEGCEPVAVSARNAATGSKLARQYGLELLGDWRELVQRDDVDAVAISTFNDSHGPITIAALEAGKHVYVEYPLARRPEEGARILELAASGEQGVRTTHAEPLSPPHQALKAVVADRGPLLTGLFVRLTPGRGARPEILFNLAISGPPALFFAYQVYPLVDLFGPAAWVEAHAEYGELNRDGGYRRFVNQVNVGFAAGGTHQWTWAGGIDIAAAEQYQRLVLAGGSLLHRDGAWQQSSTTGEEPVPVTEAGGQTLEALFAADVEADGDGWRQDLQRAFQAAQIGWAAERAAQAGGRVRI